jgi:transcription-repair coupling factor (superfamily II helicase)
LSQRLPPVHAFAGKSVDLKGGDTIRHEALAELLVLNGFQRVDTVRESGEFAIRGGIVDIFPVNAPDPIRLDFFGDQLDSLKTFDALTQKTLEKIYSIRLQPVSEIILTPQAVTTFRSQFRQTFGASPSLLYEAISQGRRYAGMEHWLPLFF